MDHVRRVTQLPTVSILANPQFLGLRSCAGSCLAADDAFAQDLFSYIGCNYPYYNTCYCNPSIVPQASSFISSCVSVACSEVADVPGAFSAWEGYCSSVGLPVNNVAQTTESTITSSTVTVPTTLQVTVVTTIAPTVTATSSDRITPSSPSLSGTAAVAATSSVDSSSQSTSTLVASSSSSSTTPTPLNVGAIAGGVVGGVVVIEIVAIIITMLYLQDRRRRREQQAAQPQPQPQTWQQPPDPSVLTEKIPKTPAMTTTIPIYHGGEERAQQRQPELDGAARMGPELEGVAGMNPELEGWGSSRPRTHVPEMQG